AAETDFLQEAKNIDDFQDFLKKTDNHKVVAPDVYHDISTKKVLVMTRFFGVSMIDDAAMRQYCKYPAQGMDGEQHPPKTKTTTGAPTNVLA
ncbi:hypothetical protein KC220_23135, partial [Mycobacterium tuberculosis]|nr:hypothetical protein [Mycobacterium tuberculosis]